MGLKRINVCKVELIGWEVRLVRKHLSQPRAPALTQCCLLTTDKSPPLSLRCFFYHPLFCFYWLNSPQTVKNLPVIQETQVWSQGQEDPLEKGMATHSMDREAWWATVHGVTKSQTWLSDLALAYISLAVLGLRCSMWDLVPWPGIEPLPSALGEWSLSHWTTREVPKLTFQYMSLITSLQVPGGVPLPHGDSCKGLRWSTCAA